MFRHQAGVTPTTSRGGGGGGGRGGGGGGGGGGVRCGGSGGGVMEVEAVQIGEGIGLGPFLFAFRAFLLWQDVLH